MLKFQEKLNWSAPYIMDLGTWFLCETVKIVVWIAIFLAFLCGGTSLIVLPSAAYLYIPTM